MARFVILTLLRQEHGDGVDKALRSERLFQRDRFRTGRTAQGQSADYYDAQCRPQFQKTLDQLLAIHIRESQVDHSEREIRFGGAFQRFSPVPNGRNLMTSPFQATLEEREQRGFVVDNQDRAVHSLHIIRDRRMRHRLFALAVCIICRAEDVTLPGLKQPVEILRDRWGIPHIYAQTAEDVFFAQGYMAARDRLFQIDLWRRIGTGKLAEVLGPQAVARDRIARLVKFRGDWKQEWESYSPDARPIAVAFTSGINAYIRSLNGKRPVEFDIAGFDPGQWEPEDVVSRIAGLLMTRNLTREVQRAQDIERFGLDTVQRYMPPDPMIKIEIPKELDLKGITNDLLRDYIQAIGGVRFDRQRTAFLGQSDDGDAFLPQLQGSNNWVVSGARSVTGKPLLANDPHRPVNLPSLRKTVHLVGPGWNVIGAGEPALPGIALGHNEEIAFGFTIVGIDQGDLYVEKVNPANPNQYRYKGQWWDMKIVEEMIGVRGAAGRKVQLRYTNHGPVLAEDLGRHRAYALKWVGSEPGTAGYFAALRLSRARSWDEFQSAALHYKVPSENLVYADRKGNIGWIASGMAPIRKNWPGLLPVPGHTGEYEWSGYLPPDQNPRIFNPSIGSLATANHNILPAGYRHRLSFEWAPPFRYKRVDEMLREKQKFSVEDFQRMQQDVTSIPAREFQEIVRRWKPAAGTITERERQALNATLNWNARLDADSKAAMIFELWLAKMHAFVFGQALGSRVDQQFVLRTLAEKPNPEALLKGLQATMRELEQALGNDMGTWQWGRVHQIHFRHPIDRGDFHRGPMPRPGDGNTVNSTSGSNFRQTNGASYRQIIDVSDWDKSVMTNVPGESGDPSSEHYSDLLAEWARGGYHPMLYSRKAVEAATVERIRLNPK